MKEEEESDQDKLDLEATEILREEQGTHRILTDLFIALFSLPRICAGQMRLFTIQMIKFSCIFKSFRTGAHQIMFHMYTDIKF